MHLLRSWQTFHSTGFQKITALLFGQHPFETSAGQGDIRIELQWVGAYMVSWWSTRIFLGQAEISKVKNWRNVEKLQIFLTPLTTRWNFLPMTTLLLLHVQNVLCPACPHTSHQRSCWLHQEAPLASAGSSEARVTPMESPAPHILFKDLGKTEERETRADKRRLLSPYWTKGK